MYPLRLVEIYIRCLSCGLPCCGSAPKSTIQRQMLKLCEWLTIVAIDILFLGGGIYTIFIHKKSPLADGNYLGVLSYVIRIDLPIVFISWYFLFYSNNKRNPFQFKTRANTSDHNSKHLDCRSRFATTRSADNTDTAMKLIDIHCYPWLGVLTVLKQFKTKENHYILANSLDVFVLLAIQINVIFALFAVALRNITSDEINQQSFFFVYVMTSDTILLFVLNIIANFIIFTNYRSVIQMRYIVHRFTNFLTFYDKCHNYNSKSKTISFDEDQDTKQQELTGPERMETMIAKEMITLTQQQTTIPTGGMSTASGRSELCAPTVDGVDIYYRKDSINVNIDNDNDQDGDKDGNKHINIAEEISKLHNLYYRHWKYHCATMTSFHVSFIHISTVAYMISVAFWVITIVLDSYSQNENRKQDSESNIASTYVILTVGVFFVLLFALIPLSYFPCETTKQYHILRSKWNTFLTHCDVKEAWKLKQLIDIRPINCHIYVNWCGQGKSRYEVSYGKIFKALVSVVFVRLIAYGVLNNFKLDNDDSIQNNLNQLNQLILEMNNITSDN